VYLKPLGGVPFELSSIDSVERGFERRRIRRTNIWRGRVQRDGFERSRLVERGGTKLDPRVRQRISDRTVVVQPDRDLADLSSRRGPHRQRRHHSGRDGLEGQREGKARCRYLRQPTRSA
jgi:hypothetical protein